MERAKCRGNEDPAFFPEKGDNSLEVGKYCASCPVQVDCLEYAIKYRLDEGYWGGMSANQRARLRRKRAKE
jgi:WhiB family redox-sensing transcriptional regulator